MKENSIEEDKKILKELEQKYYKNGEIKIKALIQDNKHLDFIMQHTISVQKVKDKIEYLDKQQKQWLEDRELKTSDSEIIFARDVLRELLEGRK